MLAACCVFMGVCNYCISGRLCVHGGVLTVSVRAMYTWGCAITVSVRAVYAWGCAITVSVRAVYHGV